MEDIYYKSKEAESKQELEFFIYLYPLTKINGVPETKPVKIPFKFLTFLAQIQNLLSIEKLYEKAIQVIGCSEQDLSFEAFKFILKRTENWLIEVKKIIETIKDVKKKNSVLNKIEIFTIPEKLDEYVIDKLDKTQIKGIALFSEFIMQDIPLEPNIIQNKIFTIAKEELEIPPKRLFEALYIIILGKKSGPRLGPFITMLDKSWLLTRLNQVID
jgi:lysyl-tRNA synthetase class 1